MNLKRNFLWVNVLFCLLSGGFLFTGCIGKESDAGFKLTGDTVADGKKLAGIYCTKCHALVPVDALTRDVWIHHTLPSMAHYLGLRSYMDGYFKSNSDTGGVSLLQYQAIVSYYKKMSPQALSTVKNQVPLVNDWAGFVLKKPEQVNHTVYTTMAVIDTFSHEIYTSDYQKSNFTQWDGDLKPVFSTELPSSAVSGLFFKDKKNGNSTYLSCVGRTDPVDFPNGRVVKMDLDSKNIKTDQTLFASDLNRPVQTIEADFNKDGLSDKAILEQGHLKGGVYLFLQKSDHSYAQSAVTTQPGAVQGVTGDFNNDGYPDLMILFGSGDEGLWLFLNDQKGGFTAKNLLRFPPVYGSTSFQLADMDHDGKPDLIYTCGYNFHDSRILKPYHGLYIFKNIGNWNFKQQYFYPIDGCTKAITADFDADGDLDIATSAFFADMQNDPAEGFIYFEQDKPFSFKPHAVPISKYGRWMSMDVGDYNNDGKPDIILGNYSTGFLFQPGFRPSWSKNIPFIVLENNMKK